MESIHLDPYEQGRERRPWGNQGESVNHLFAVARKLMAFSQLTGGIAFLPDIERRARFNSLRARGAAPRRREEGIHLPLLKLKETQIPAVGVSTGP